MSRNILESAARVRLLLAKPKTQKPSLHEIYAALVRNFQDMYNELSNTDEAWSLDEADIDVDLGNDCYPIPTQAQGTFGKPFLLTTFSTDDAAIERVIPFFDEQNVKFDWFLPNNYAGWNPFYTGGNHTAERVTLFYDKAGVPTLRFMPAPLAPATYRLKFTIGNWADSANIGASPVLSNHHHLFEVRSAKDVLYMSEWSDADKKETMEKRKEIRSFLDEMETRYLPAFKRYIKEMTHDGITFLKAWDE